MFNVNVATDLVKRQEDAWVREFEDRLRQISAGGQDTQ